MGNLTKHMKTLKKWTKFTVVLWLITSIMFEKNHRWNGTHHVLFVVMIKMYKYTNVKCVLERLHRVRINLCVCVCVCISGVLCSALPLQWGLLCNGEQQKRRGREGGHHCNSKRHHSAHIHTHKEHGHQSPPAAAANLCCLSASLHNTLFYADLSSTYSNNTRQYKLTDTKDTQRGHRQQCSPDRHFLFNHQ